MRHDSSPDVLFFVDFLTFHIHLNQQFQFNAVKPPSSWDQFWKSDLRESIMCLWYVTELAKLMKAHLLLYWLHFPGRFCVRTRSSDTLKNVTSQRVLCVLPFHRRHLEAISDIDLIQTHERFQRNMIFNSGVKLQLLTERNIMKFLKKCLGDN